MEATTGTTRLLFLQAFVMMRGRVPPLEIQHAGSTEKLVVEDAANFLAKFAFNNPYRQWCRWPDYQLQIPGWDALSGRYLYISL